MYISVLNSDLSKSPWLAIQWDNSLTALLNNLDYNPAVSSNFPKSSHDVTIQTKTVTDVISGNTPTATVIQLAGITANIEEGVAPKEKAAKKKPTDAPSKKTVAKKTIAKKPATKKRSKKSSEKK